MRVKEAIYAIVLPFLNRCCEFAQHLRCNKTAPCGSSAVQGALNFHRANTDMND